MFSCRYQVQLLLVAILSIASPAFAQRLPSTAVPSHYDISVEPDLASATFTGTVRIAVLLEKPSTTIVLNSAEITFDSITITAGGRTETARVSLDEAKEQATFTVDRPLPAGEAQIDIKYRGILNDDLRGLYLSKANGRRYAVTQLEATDARRMFPSFDEPALKATFTLTATIDAGDHAISNGAIVSDTPVPGRSRHTIRFETTPKMSTYLVALAVGDFDCSGGSADGIPIRVCSTPDKKGQTGFALQAAEKVLEYYDRYYSVKYPFKKLDIVAVPDFAAGAMENTAAIFYRETYLLADPSSASVENRRNIATVLAHEMAHQWFGDLVTMQWWDDIWLNEGFANWMETRPVKAWKPEWHEELDEVQSNQTAMSVDSLRSTRPIRARASTPAEINELFDAIAYQKGAAVLRMVEAWVGEEPFRRGVNAYIEGFKYGNARAEDFWSTLTTSTGKPVDRVMKTFVDQPGVPLVTVNLRCDTSPPSALLSQERYALEKSAPAELWNIPVCVKTSAGARVCDLLTQKSGRVPLESCPAWLTANADARGYYRGAMSAELLRAVGSAIGSLDPTERIALLSDEWGLVKALRRDVGSYLDLVSRLGNERSADVMQTVAGTLETIGDDLTTDGSRDKYRSRVASLLRPALQEIGWTPGAAEPDETRSLRATLVGALGRTARDPEVLRKSREVVLQELVSPGSTDPTLLNVVVLVAAVDGDASLYDRYVARSRAATDSEERYRYLNALTAFSDRALVRRTMDYILGPEVRSQDAKVMIAGLLTNSDARVLAWPLLQARWDDIQKKTGEFVGNTVIVGALGSFCDTKTLDEIRRFFATHKVPDAERTLQQSMEHIETCAAMAAAQRGKLDAWLAASRR